MTDHPTIGNRICKRYLKVMFEILKKDIYQPLTDDLLKRKPPRDHRVFYMFGQEFSLVRRYHPTAWQCESPQSGPTLSHPPHPTPWSAWQCGSTQSGPTLSHPTPPHPMVSVAVRESDVITPHPTPPHPRVSQGGSAGVRSLVRRYHTHPTPPHPMVSVAVRQYAVWSDVITPHPTPPHPMVSVAVRESAVWSDVITPHPTPPHPIVSQGGSAGVRSLIRRYHTPPHLTPPQLHNLSCARIVSKYDQIVSQHLLRNPSFARIVSKYDQIVSQY